MTWKQKSRIKRTTFAVVINTKMPRYASELSLSHCPVHPSQARISPLPWGLQSTLHKLQETWQLVWPCPNTKQVTRSQARTDLRVSQSRFCSVGLCPCKRWLLKTWLWRVNFRTANCSTPLLLTSWIISFIESVPVPHANASNRDVGVSEPLQLLHCLAGDSRVWEGGRRGAAPFWLHHC